MGKFKKRYCETWFKTSQHIVNNVIRKSVSNETNGIEPKSNTFIKKSPKKVPLKQIVPGHSEL